MKTSNHSFAGAFLTLLLSTAILGCEKEPPAPPAYTPNIKDPYVWIEGQIGFRQSSAADLCSGRDTFVEIYGRMVRGEWSLYGQWPFSTVAGKVAFDSSCADWRVDVKLEHRIQSHDANGNPTFIWVPAYNNSSIGHVDANCQIRLTPGIDIQGEDKQIKINVTGKPNTSANCVNGCLTGMTVQCHQTGARSAPLAPQK